MTELEKMQRAKMYLDKLANGIDPISDREMPDDTVLNQVRLSRCLFYVSDILRQVIENGGQIGRGERVHKQPFSVTEEMRQNMYYSESPVAISQLLGVINSLIDVQVTRKLAATTVTGWLVEQGLLRVEAISDGRTHKLPTERGMQLGMTSEQRSGQYGEYDIVLYNEQAQRIIVDNLEPIVKYGQDKREHH